VKLPDFSQLRAAIAARAGVRHAQVVQALPLGPGSRLIVVEFEGRRLLIGQSRAGFTRLDGPAQ
jgi:hypothetical protein